MNAAPTQRSHGFFGRAALAVAVIIGAFLIVIPFATGLPGKSEASSNLMSAFRPAMTDAALAQGQTDLQTMNAMGQQLQTGVLPTMASQLKMTPAQLNAYLASNYPAVAKGMAQFTGISTLFTNLQTTIKAQQANFQQADQIPTSFLAPTSMTLLFVIPGAVLLIIGVGLFRPEWTRRLLAATGVVGLTMVVGLLSVSMYPKASAADSMTAAFAPVFAAQNVQQAQAYTNTVQAMETQLTIQTLPGLATALHMTPAQFNGLMATNFPAVATGVGAFPAIVHRMQSETALIAANVDNYNQSASIPWSPGSMVLVFWFMMVPAGLAVLIGAGALLLTGHRPAVLSAPTPHGAMHS